MAGRPRKTATKQEEVKQENVQVEEVKVEKVIEKPVEKVVEKRQLSRTDLIPIMNYTTGQLVYKSRDGQTWLFTEFGDTDEITLGELVSMKNSHARMLNEGWVLILDDDAVGYLGLTKHYETLLPPNQIEELFTLSDERIGEILDKISPSAQEVVFNKAKEFIEKKKLNSLSTIQLIEDKLKVELIEK